MTIRKRMLADQIQHTLLQAFVECIDKQKLLRARSKHSKLLNDRLKSQYEWGRSTGLFDALLLVMQVMYPKTIRPPEDNAP